MRSAYLYRVPFIVCCIWALSCGEEQPDGEEQPINAVSSLEDVRSAVVRIVSKGTFVGLEGVIPNQIGSGSGFFIDQDGTIVTNNHVVTGAGLVNVFVDGEDEPRLAKIVGVSECSDLAVIKIEGENFPYLRWYEGDRTVSMDVYAAGFPLGASEFTMNRGIISKESVSGTTPQADVKSVVEHDATIRPGNSGGPLVNQEGLVVGVNYAGIEATLQYFAISGEEAQGIVSELSHGVDVESIGINGATMKGSFDDGSPFGIWVYSVASGSKASAVGVRAGDIIHKMEGLFLGEKGTLADYCGILRSKDTQSAISITVYRRSSGPFWLPLTGEINGSELKPI